jgi:Raf kinase inhibitor-like YbhB/YbcL family protein
MGIDRHICYLVAVAMTSLQLGGCDAEDAPKAHSRNSSNTGAIRTMKLQSSGFENGAKIDVRYTVESQDVSPPLSWTDVPTGTASFALICDDPDAPSPRRPASEPWVHWVLFNIAADIRELPPAIGREAEPVELPGARQGVNSWPSDNIGYRGPAPPPGSGEHRYFFKLYALDTTLDLDPGATKQQVLSAMSGHVLAEGQLMGVYQR